MSYGGLTMAISLFSDLFGLLTANIYVCYYITATIYQHQLRMAGSLWNLFRGALCLAVYFFPRTDSSRLVIREALQCPSESD